MRVSPIGYISNDLETVIKEAKNTANNSHSHPEWIKWAQCIASVIYLARKGKNKEQIKEYVENEFWYDLNRKLDEIRPDYRFDETCQWTVPEAIISFLESNDFEDAIRNAISIWGDSDTLACITWWIAEAYYWVPEDIKSKVLSYLPEELKLVVDNFYKKYNNNNL